MKNFLVEFLRIGSFSGWRMRTQNNDLLKFNFVRAVYGSLFADSWLIYECIRRFDADSLHLVFGDFVEFGEESKNVTFQSY